MAIRTYKVTLDSKNIIAPEPVYLRQGDKTGAVVINATLMDNGAPVSLSGLTPMFKANTADGQAVIADSTGFNIVNASGGEFTYQVPNALSAIPGKIVTAYFSFSDASGSESTFDVAFIIKKAVDITKPQAADYITIIDGTIKSLQQKIDSMNTDIQTVLNAYNQGDFYNKSETDSKDRSTLSSAKAYTDNSLSGIVALPETFTNLAAIQAKYPNGANGIMVAADNGHKYIWANSTWTDAGIYQSMGIADETVTPEKTTFASGIKQMVDQSLLETGKFWNANPGGPWSQNETTNIGSYPPIQLDSRQTYTIYGCRGIFSGTGDQDGNNLAKFSSTDSVGVFEITPTEPVQLYLTTRPSDGGARVFNASQAKLAEQRIDVKDNALGYRQLLIDGLDVDGSSLSDNSVEPDKLKNTTVIREILDESKAIKDTYWYFINGKISAKNVSGWVAYPPIALDAGKTYSVLSAKGIFSGIGTSDDEIVRQFATTDETSDYEWTANAGEYLYISRLNSEPKVMSGVSLADVTEGMRSATFGLYSFAIEGLKLPTTYNEISVRTAAELLSEIKSIPLTNSNQIRIMLQAGTYDLYTAFGGKTYVDDVTAHPDVYKESAGLVLPDNVSLTGVGDVTLTYICPDEVATTESAQRISVINAYMSHTIKNIKFVGKNTRYVSHPETGNRHHHQTQVWEDCTFTHQGNRADLWQNTTAVAGGTGSGGSYTYRRCKFIGATAANSAAFSYHDNANQDSNTLALESCYFETHGDDAIRLGTYGVGSEIHSCVITNSQIIGRIYTKEEQSGSGDGNRWQILGGGNSRVPYKNTNSVGAPLRIIFSDETMKLTNNTTTAIATGTPVGIHGPSTMGVIGSGQAHLYVGVALEDVAPGETGLVKISGYLAASDTGLKSVTALQKVYLKDGSLSEDSTGTAIGLAVDADNIRMM